MRALFHWLTLTSHLGLIALLSAWLTWLAPPAHYPVALALIVLVGPLLVPLRGLLHGRPRAHFWAALMALVYFVIAVDDLAGVTAPRALAWAELGLALGLFVGGLGYARLSGRAARD